MGITIKGKRGGSGCMVLFSLPFAAVGVASFGYLVYTIWNYTQAQQWEEVPAFILSGDLNESRGSEGGYTYSLSATYRYEYDGVSYTGDRAGLFVGSDNISNWHHDRYAELEPFIGQNKPFRCFVNPANPTDSILFRDLRIGMVLFVLLFACVFGSVGFGLLIGSVVDMGKVKERTKRETYHPTEPWTWKPEWAGGRIESNEKVAAFGLMAFATIWLLISAPATVFVPGEIIKTQNYLLLVVFIFPVIGVLMLGAGLMYLARWRKYGTSLFELEGPTGVLGGYLRGMVHVPQPLDAPSGVHAALRCIEERSTGSGKNRKTTSNTLWESEQILLPVATRSGLTVEGVSLPIAFVIPYTLPEPGELGEKKVIWKLALKAETPGLDYHADFEVPVFKTPESRADMTSVTVEANAAPGMPTQQAVPLNPRVVRVDLFEDGSVFTYPRTRHLTAGIFLLLFGAFFSAIAFLLATQDIGYVFLGIWSITSAGLIVTGLAFLLNEIEVEVSKNGISIRNNYLLFSRTRAFAREEIAEITTRSNMQVGNDSYYAIYVKTNAGKEVTAGSGIPSSNQAEQLIALMTQAM